MEYIFHEKQEGRLCAQHCLNSLLQGPYFSPVELSDLAHSIDNLERVQMAECGTESQSYRDFIEAPSENVDDSGYFSLEVLNAALLPWNLELVPYNSSEERALKARENTSSMSAYICNYHQHWYTIRKIGNQWFNLDSTMKSPKLLSNTYLDIYLAQIRNEGYSVFIVFGDLPPCEADEILKICPVSEKSEKKNRSRELPNINHIVNDEDEDEKNLKLALQLSLNELPKNHLCSNSEDDNQVHVEQLRKKRIQRFAPQ